MNQQPLVFRFLGRVNYENTFRQMREFTHERDRDITDELWVVEHPPVFTQGQAGKAEHLLNPGDIPVVQSDRGGQITYHGPGQLVAYPLLDLRRLKLNVRSYVSALENSIVNFLSDYGVKAEPRPDAPGVYVKDAKIASLGIRVRKGCCFHGLALNIDMDLKPFLSINPCGYPQLKMVQLSDYVAREQLPTLEQAARQYAQHLAQELGVRLVNST